VKKDKNKTKKEYVAPKVKEEEFLVDLKCEEWG
jgi:hypothetical protein